MMEGPAGERSYESAIVKLAQIITLIYSHQPGHTRSASTDKLDKLITTCRVKNTFISSS